MRLLPPPDGPARPESPADCSACDYDLHRCLGCGNPLQHGIDVCLRCRNAYGWPDNATPSTPQGAS